MNQNNRGNYRTKESFTHSCLGRFVITAAVLGAVLFIAHITVPDRDTMIEEMEDNIRQCIMANDSIRTDGIDDAINNVGYTFTHADSTFDLSLWETFLKYNRLEYHRHAFYATTRIVNNFHPDGIRSGIGIFSLVIPTVNYDDFILTVDSIHKGYGKELIKTETKEMDFGEQPHIKEYHYQGESTQ